MEFILETFYEQVKANLNEIREEVERMQATNEVGILSYFTYSFNLAHHRNKENLCLGSYHIRNLSKKPIRNPYICIKIPKDSPFSFTGKYHYKNKQPKTKESDGWERINAQENPEQFWLKPLGQETIQPNETISFSNFQVKWTPLEDYAGSIMGFTYSEENQQGIAAINAINLGGTTFHKEDVDE